MSQEYEIFIAAPPGLEAPLADEARAEGFAAPQLVPGGVVTQGDWAEIWRANLALRGAGRVLVRVAEFMAFHPAQLDKRSRKLPWGDWLRPDIPVRVEAVCRKSKIYHAGAAADRVARAITATLGAPATAVGGKVTGDGTEDGPGVTVKLRIEDNRVTISLDSSGEPLHRRGMKAEVGKAPMRETMAAAFLRQCGYDGRMPILDPMCGSGTFVAEAAAMGAGLAPGRARGFAFQHFASFEPGGFDALRRAGPQAAAGPLRCWGSDRDQGAIRMANANAERAGVAAICRFDCRPAAEIAPPEGAEGPGLVIVNPPYGARIGARKPLFALHGALGAVLKERFTGWRVGLVTSDEGLARATGLPWDAPGPHVAHGGLKVRLWQAQL